MNNFTIVNKTSALLAKRNSGKSVLLKHFVESERHKFNKIFVICPTEKISFAVRFSTLYADFTTHYKGIQPLSTLHLEPKENVSIKNGCHTQA